MEKKITSFSSDHFNKLDQVIKDANRDVITVQNLKESLEQAKNSNQDLSITATNDLNRFTIETKRKHMETKTILEHLELTFINFRDNVNSGGGNIDRMSPNEMAAFTNTMTHLVSNHELKMKEAIKLNNDLILELTELDNFINDMTDDFSDELNTRIADLRNEIKSLVDSHATNIETKLNTLKRLNDEQQKTIIALSKQVFTLERHVEDLNVSAINANLVHQLKTNMKTNNDAIWQEINKLQSGLSKTPKIIKFSENY